MSDVRRVSVLRLVSAATAMTVVMLLVAALGEWVLIPSSWVQEMDEGGVARATGLVTEHPALLDVADVWAQLSGPWLVHPTVALVAGVLIARRRITVRAGVVTVAIGLFGWWLGAVCKGIVERPRPDRALVEMSSWSYPSGHSTNIALGAVLLIALVTAVRTAWIRWATTTLALFGVALTAADRVLLGVHHVSDVAMGLSFGAVAALAALALLPQTRPAESVERRG